jgi:hypothetical protein
MVEIVEVEVPETPRESSVYGDEESTYQWWVQEYGKAEADRLADVAGIPPEKRKAADG